MEMDRHDLAYLRPAANLHFLESGLTEYPKQKIRDLLQENIPLTVCRQDQLGGGQVKLAMSCFVAGQKYRIALIVDQADILKFTRPVTLQRLVTHFTVLQTLAFTNFLIQMQRLDCEVYVYGSYAYQYLTQEQYINAGSDLDMVLYPQHARNLMEILSHVQQLKQQTALSIDGEIKIHPEWHVSFNELIQILPDLQQQIIAKGIKRIGLFTLEELLGSTHANTVNTA